MSWLIFVGEAYASLFLSGMVMGQLVLWLEGHRGGHAIQPVLISAEQGDLDPA